MGFNVNVSVSALTVFLQGLLSFFSPCVLPLLPLYIGYLSGGTGVRGEDGVWRYDRKKVLLHTLFFVIGVSFAFVLLGLGASALGHFFQENQLWFARIGGVLVILFGLYQLGVFGTSQTLNRERRLPFRLDKWTMSPLTALVMGFTFSFAWTPCVGPAMTSVLLMTASAATRWEGMALMGVYTLGFVLPFLAVGVFTTALLAFFKSHQNVVKYTVKVGGALMILMGILMLSGGMEKLSGWLSGLSSPPAPTAAVESIPTPSPTDAPPPVVTPEAEPTPEPTPTPETTPEPAETPDITSTPEPTPAAAASDTPEPTETPEPKPTAAASPSPTETPPETQEPEPSEEPEETVDPNAIPALDFTLTDQFGNTHSLADYAGKTIFLNFWATWCPPCRAEMPEIQQLYENYSREGEDALIVLGVAWPGVGGEKTAEEIAAFLEDNGYTYPVLMDTEGGLFNGYGITAFPTTFMIDRDGNVFGYLTGQMTYDIMVDIVTQTMTGERK